MVQRGQTDRVSDVWGARTPHAADEPWPSRVDQFLLDGYPADRVAWSPSACVLCSNGCGLDIAVADGKVVGVRGDDTDRVNHGRLGPKGLYGWQAINAPDRLTTPLARRDGNLEPLTGRRSRSARRAHQGPARKPRPRRDRLLQLRPAVPRGLLRAD